MKIIGIIPARGGSKGIVDKNIIKLNNKPLISYTIESAISSDCFDKIVVSTDSEKIINVVSDYEVDILMRSKKNSSDLSPMTNVIKETLDSLDEKFDLVILLQPTAPLRRSEDFKNIIYRFSTHNINSLVSIVRLDDINPARMYYLELDNKLKSLDKKNQHLRRQDLKTVCIRNGSFYAFKTTFFDKHNKLYDENTIAYEMPSTCWLNIDEERDIIIAESLINHHFNKPV